MPWTEKKENVKNNNINNRNECRENSFIRQKINNGKGNVARTKTLLFWLCNGYGGTNNNNNINWKVTIAYLSSSTRACLKEALLKIFRKESVEDRVHGGVGVAQASSKQEEKKLHSRVTAGWCCILWSTY